MNNIAYQPTGVYKVFAQNPVRLSNPPKKAENTLSSPDINENNKAKRVLKRCAIGIMAALAVAGVVYYKKASKTLTLSDENPILKLSDKKFKQHLAEHVFTAEHEAELISLRDKYQKCANGIIGKINKCVCAVHGFFKNNFFNY